MSVDESVDQIQQWLADKAPRLLSMVNPPVSNAEYNAVVREVQAAPSQDLAAWWRRMNGLSSDVIGALIPPGYSPISATAALEFWRMHRSVQYDYHPEHQHSELDEFLVRLMDEPAGSSCGQPCGSQRGCLSPPTSAVAICWSTSGKAQRMDA